MTTQQQADDPSTDCGTADSGVGTVVGEFIGPKNPAFPTTHWSFIVSMKEGDTTTAFDKLTVLCRTYWYPIYAFIRRKGFSPHDAQDLTQEFFAQLLARDSFAAADERRGKFRSYLLGAMNHFLANEWRARSRQKRGGGQPPISIEAEMAEKRYRNEPSHAFTPEMLYDRHWALTVLQEVIAELEQDFSDQGKAQDFEVLNQFLSWNSGEETYREAAGRLGKSEGAVKTAVNRMRNRYRDLLRRHIQRTVVSPDEVDDEIRYLLSLFSR